MTGREDTEGTPIPTALSAVSLSAAFVALTWWSWACWTQPMIDFGLELYVPWRLTEGDALYRDIASRNGPLSHHVNALAFTLFGASLRTLVWVNLAIAAAITVLVFRLLRRAFDSTAAFFGALAFLGVFGFSQYVGIANYNYVTPYQHGQTHGVLLWLSTVSLVLGRSPRAAFGAGLCAGLAFLTKLEVFVPTAACLAVGAWRTRAPLRPLALGLVLPPLVALTALALAMPFGDALRGVLGNWLFLGAGTAGQGFYERVMGTDRPAHHLAESVAWLGRYAGAAAVGWLLQRVLRDRVPARFVLPGACAVAAAVAVGLVLATEPETWVDAGYGLNLAAGIALVGAVVAHVRRPGTATLARLLWALGACCFLLKMALFPRLGHYGFALAMPAGLLLVALFTGGGAPLPRVGPWARAVGAGVVLAAITSLLQVTQSVYEVKTASVGAGPDRMRAVGSDPLNLIASQLLQRLDEAVGPDDTLLVLPEGTMLNFLLRRRNPSRYQLFLPPEFAAAGGDDVMVEDFERDPPDWLVIVPRDHREYGVGRFWQSGDNGAAIGAWFQRHYEGYLQLPVRVGETTYNSVILRRP